ncbi:TetR family transcriptional regulator [Streptomyces sp. NPDC007984]|uniref:TetR/AcrR family transcriptional regulator n=1 Tax=Streptomyces sp. NPDC007984 TaxID=3364801 RepID=UPI0036E9F13E
MDPRIGRTRASVLQHARELLAAEGPDAVTYSELSARSQVTRQTLYRHWPTRERLFLDIVLEGPALPYPDGTGSPEQIITEFLLSFRAGMQVQATASALLMLVAQADYDPPSHEALSQIVANRLEALNTLLRPTGVLVTPEQFAQLCGPVLYQRFFARTDPSDDFIRDLVRTHFAVRT